MIVEAEASAGVRHVSSGKSVAAPRAGP
jgi:hypothetical protein